MTSETDHHHWADDRDTDAAPYAAALAALPGAGPAVLGQILRDWTPEEAWSRIRAGRLDRPQSHITRGEAQLDFALPSATASRPSRARPLSDPARPPTDPAGPTSDPARPPTDLSGDSDYRGDPGRESRRRPSWWQMARRVDPPGWWARHAAAGIAVTWPGRADYPSALFNDPDPPGVLFWRGDLRHLGRPCVAVVGTRRASHDGRSVAFELGRDLAAAGVCVVSGLALGIDGAAHAGVLSVRTSASAAGPAGVAASAVDVPYPRRHAGLWEQVVQSGVMLSETPPGRPPQAWRFPARNRIIAGLSAMVVVVESHAAGGGLITAEAALARGVEVRVVPGSVHSSASAGTNQLLYDGAGPVRDSQDVLDGLGIFVAPGAARFRDRESARSRHLRRLAAGMAPAPDGPVLAKSSPTSSQSRAAALPPEARRVLEAVAWQPTLLGRVVDRTGLPPGAVSGALELLEAAGLVSRDEHWWVRRSDR